MGSASKHRPRAAGSENGSGAFSPMAGCWRQGVASAGIQFGRCFHSPLESDARQGGCVVLVSRDGRIEDSLDRAAVNSQSPEAVNGVQLPTIGIVARCRYSRTVT